MWVKKKSKKYNTYYFFNTETMESSWERPTEGFVLFHILIKHSESRNPDRGLSKEEALSLCQSICEDIKPKLNQKEFMEAARKHSKCSSSKRGGYLGVVVGNEMIKEFEEVAFKLEKGEMAGPVETVSGFHLIYRK